MLSFNASLTFWAVHVNIMQYKEECIFCCHSSPSVRLDLLLVTLGHENHKANTDWILQEGKLLGKKQGILGAPALDNLMSDRTLPYCFQEHEQTQVSLRKQRLYTYFICNLWTFTHIQTHVGAITPVRVCAEKDKGKHDPRKVKKKEWNITNSAECNTPADNNLHLCVSCIQMLLCVSASKPTILQCIIL